MAVEERFEIPVSHIAKLCLQQEEIRKENLLIV